MAESQGSGPYHRGDRALQTPDLSQIPQSEALQETEEGWEEMCRLVQLHPLPKKGAKKRQKVAEKLLRIVEDRRIDHIRKEILNLLVVSLDRAKDLNSSIKWGTRKELGDEDSLRRSGNITFNEHDSEEPERYPANIVLKFLIFQGTKQSNSETRIERTIGYLLTGVIAGEGADDKE
jgi:hypothetical protein